LLFGDYPELARRCLHSICKALPSSRCELRLGSNAISQATYNVIADEFGACFPVANWYDSPTNIHKYPLMRRMLHDPLNPVTTPYVMWFDDDSYLQPDLNGAKWLDAVVQQMATADMIGKPYTMGWGGRQRDWVKAQPWYNGNDPYKRAKLSFLTGGWWCLRADVLRRFDYPWRELDHNGGDTMLGELCVQQGLRKREWYSGVVINAAKRRGFESKPLGFHGPGAVAAANGLPQVKQAHKLSEPWPLPDF
jgi:hypothetical protein